MYITFHYSKARSLFAEWQIEFESAAEFLEQLWPDHTHNTVKIHSSQSVQKVSKQRSN